MTSDEIVENGRNRRQRWMDFSIIWWYYDRRSPLVKWFC